MRFALVTAFSFLIASAFGQRVTTSNVEYKEGSTALEGYKAFDASKTGKRPGVLIIHDWNSIDEYERSRARQLAELGYVAFAADIYGKGVRPKNAQESGAEAGKYRANNALFRARLKASLEELKRDPNVDPTKVAVIGYCFGGTGALELARSGAEIAGAVSFHGSIATNDHSDAKKIKARILVCHGAIDPMVPPAHVEHFIKEMESGGVDYQLIEYSGAVHGFTEPNAGSDKSTGVAYDAKADRRSWEHMKIFFSEIFK